MAARLPSLLFFQYLRIFPTMKEKSKERMAQLLLDELLAELGDSEKIRKMLGDLTALPLDEVVGKLVEDVEDVIARRRLEALELLKVRPPDPVSPDISDGGQAQPVQSPAPPEISEELEPPLPVSEESPRSTSDEPAVAVSSAGPVKEPPVPSEPTPVSPAPPDEPPAIAGPGDVHTPPEPDEIFLPPAEPGALFWGDLEQMIKKETTSSDEPSGPAGEEPAGEVEEEFHGSLAEADSGELRTATEFGDEDVVYVHGVTMIPEREKPAEKPFMLEEKGIDGRSFAFAFDYEGMRFYLSKILPSVMSVSKSGMLLLGKQESLQARSTHESILNELRLHGVLLPFEFGTLARGRDDLMGKVDAVRERLIEAIETIQATRWWVVKLFVLDARIAQIVGKDDTGPARRGRATERASYMKMPLPKKFDIKVLERMLGKEKRIAESVHEELKNEAERSDIDKIVGLGSGSSEDWKLILEASYEVKESKLTKFFQTVTDLQYRHLTIDLMLSAVGDAEPFSFT